MKRVKVRVTWEDIARGERRECATCPVALAATRAFGEDVTVGNRMFRLRSIQYIDMPARVRAWIHEFDQGRPVRPIRFRVEAV